MEASHKDRGSSLVSLGIKITRTLPLYPLGTFLQWELIDPSESGMYTFAVDRAGSPEGPWESVMSGIQNIYNYTDQMPSTLTAGVQPVNQLSLVRGIFYRVTVVPPSGVHRQAQVVSAVEPQLDGKQKLLKRKILRDTGLMLRKLEGVEIAVCKRMHWGLICTTCRDPYTKNVVRTHDPACMGTGFQPGYFAPIITLAKRTARAVDTSTVENGGKSDSNLSQITMLDYPALAEDDVIVFLRDNRRFLVKKVLPTELQTVMVTQDVLTSELPRSAVEYRIQVDPYRIPPLY